MAATQNRPGQRIATVPLDLDLPVIDTPQYVNEEGYEIDVETFALALQDVARVDGLVQADDQEADQTEVVEEVEIEQVLEDQDVSEAVEEEQVAKPCEPLLGLAESNILCYSVAAARQHHLQSLLPHVFSHPAISANARPRARLPPKNTLLYPTPPPLAQPLPHREYHAPTPHSQGASTSSKSADEPEVKRRKYGRKGKGKANEVEPPAHDIECVARVTLSIGPISFPDTEIWVGRFVQPRAAAPRPARAKLDQSEKQRMKEERIAAKRARQPGPPTTTNPASYRPPYRPPMAGPSSQGYRPRPPPPGAIRPPAQQRAELSPDLIRRVNEAATKHPWLSQIIHKAARTQATKEELAKLGRVVNRLKEGKEIDEDGDSGPGVAGQAGPSQIQPQSEPSVSLERPAAPISGSTSATVPAAAESAKSSDDALTPPPGDGSDSEDSGSDVDMTGPEQVGGGPIDTVDPAAHGTALAVNPAIPSELHGRPTTRPPPPTFPQQPQLAVTTHRDSSSFASPPPSVRPPAYLPPNPTMVSRPPMPPYMAAPPRPTYPLPPPFLLVAFKEAPTEKFLLPLGSLSYLSRVGEKVEQPVPVTAQPKGPETPATLTTTPTTAVPASATAASKKTRASMSRGSSSQVVAATSEFETKPESEVDPSSKRINTSGLPALPGMAPPDGTVLISTFTPAGQWQKPDWQELATLLPFNNPSFGRPKPPPTDVEKPWEPDPTPSSEKSTSAKTYTDPSVPTAARDSHSLHIKSTLLNIATEPLFPDEGDLHAITIRLNDVSDHTWQRLKTINGMIVAAEMRAMAEQNPQLMPPPGQAMPHSTGPQMPPPGPIAFQPSDTLRKEYSQRKRSLFRSLLARVPSRKFLRYRLETARPDIIDATTDKWAPRPYIISTKALGNRENDYEDQLPTYAPESPPKKGTKKALEPEVTFEMPVSLDQLDEMVAENALKGKKGKGEDGRKGKGRRWVPGTICQGCGLSNKRVWRSGPGGKSTLCNSCGDKFTAGELGTLAAPGTAGQQESSGAPEDTTKQDSVSSPVKQETMPSEVQTEAVAFEHSSVFTQAPSAHVGAHINATASSIVEPLVSAPARVAEESRKPEYVAPDLPHGLDAPKEVDSLPTPSTEASAAPVLPPDHGQVL